MDRNVIITYEALYEILRREKARPEIQKLDETFFSDVIEYIEEKKSFIESQSKSESIFSATELEKTKKQLENVQKILKELYEKREHKILQLALISSRTNNNFNNMESLLPEERSICLEMLKVLSGSRNNILNSLINGQLPKKLEDYSKTKPKEINTDAKGEENKLIRILSPLPKFMGPNLEVYGPFEQETVVNLPSEIANLLIKNKKAEEINSK